MATPLVIHAARLPGLLVSVATLGILLALDAALRLASAAEMANQSPHNLWLLEGLTMNEHLTRWTTLLLNTINTPGLVLKAYSAFHQYSLGNILAAFEQCDKRQLEFGPLNTFHGWKDSNRIVKKGEKALWLCMPLTRKTTTSEGQQSEHVLTFVWKPRWFVLSQTFGEDLPPVETLGEWSKPTALQNLQIEEIAFDHFNGNVQGFSRQRQFAVSPVAAIPHKTLFHELAHIVLGHTTEATFEEDERTPRNLREVEAESVAMLCLDALNLDGQEFCRGYIQAWLKADEIPEKSAQKILSAADKILKAGRN